MKKCNSISKIKIICRVLPTILVIFAYRSIAFGSVISIPTLQIPTNYTYTVPQGDILIIKNLEMADNSKLIINGTLRFEDSGTLSDFTMLANKDATTFFTNSASNWKQNLYIENNGIIECNNFTQSFADKFNMYAIYTFKNNGTISCSGNFYSDWV